MKRLAREAVVKKSSPPVGAEEAGDDDFTPTQIGATLTLNNAIDFETNSPTNSTLCLEGSPDRMADAYQGAISELFSDNPEGCQTSGEVVVDRDPDARPKGVVDSAEIVQDKCGDHKHDLEISSAECFALAGCASNFLRVEANMTQETVRLVRDLVDKVHEHIRTGQIMPGCGARKRSFREFLDGQIDSDSNGQAIEKFLDAQFDWVKETSHILFHLDSVVKEHWALLTGVRPLFLFNVVRD